MWEIISHKIYCPLLKKDIEDGYCWELCNIATDEILLAEDKITDWDAAQAVCKECGLFEC